ncbi:MAG TPA: hypothetical protein VHE79_02840 [Spirochaetia bacterium]
MWARLTPILLVATLAVSCHKADRQPVTVIPKQAPTATSAPAQTAPAPAAAPATAPAAPNTTPAAQASPSTASSPAPAQPADKAPASGASGGQGQAAAAQPPRPGTITLAPQTAAQPTATQLSNAPAATLMANPTAGRILPDDFKIGTLGDANGARKDQRGAMTAAGSFLGALIAGEVDGKLLTPDARGTVGDSLSWGLSHGEKPTSFRLGEPRTRDDGEITAPVRLFGSQGTTEGEIYMTRSGDQWLVSDVQVSLAGLLVKRQPPKEKFFPSSYRWLLED